MNFMPESRQMPNHVLQPIKIIRTLNILLPHSYNPFEHGLLIYEHLKWCFPLQILQAGNREPMQPGALGHIWSLPVANHHSVLLLAWPYISLDLTSREENFVRRWLSFFSTKKYLGTRSSGAYHPSAVSEMLLPGSRNSLSFDEAWQHLSNWDLVWQTPLCDFFILFDLSSPRSGFRHPN